MTEQILKKALAEVMSQEENLQSLYAWFPETIAMTEDAAVAWSVEKLYSEKLRKYLSGRMMCLPVCGMQVLGMDTDDMLNGYHGQLDRTRECIVIPNVLGAKAVEVGRSSNASKCIQDFYYGSDTVCYIDEEGNVWSILEYEAQVDCYGGCVTELPRVVYRRLVLEEENKIFQLGGLYDFLPGEFRDFWEP